MSPTTDITLAIETSNPSASGGAGVCIGTLELAAFGTPALQAGGLGDLGTPALRAGGLGVHVLASASVSEESSGPKQRNEDRLMLAIDQAMNAAGLAPRQIKRIAVSVGPGGFTSVRLAVTTAKCIAEATGAQCFAVPTTLVAAYRFMAHLAANAQPTAPFAIALASKGDDAYIQAFEVRDASPVPLTQGQVLDAAAFERLAHTSRITTLLADGFLPAPIRDCAARLNIAIAPIALDPVACLAASRTIEPVDPVALLPIYPREPEAVTKWRALHADKKR